MDYARPCFCRLVVATLFSSCGAVRYKSIKLSLAPPLSPIKSLCILIHTAAVFVCITPRSAPGLLCSTVPDATDLYRPRKHTHAHERARARCNFFVLASFSKKFERMHVYPLGRSFYVPPIVYVRRIYNYRVCIRPRVHDRGVSRVYPPSKVWSRAG